MNIQDILTQAVADNASDVFIVAGLPISFRKGGAIIRQGEERLLPADTEQMLQDIYRLADMIGRQNDITVISIKDYIKNPKPSGYKSYHMIVSIPIFLSDRVVDTKVEIQIRTIAMDFWASLEHKIYYKFEGHAPAYISHDLQECSKIVSELDEKMLMLNEAILKAKQEQEDQEG